MECGLWNQDEWDEVDYQPTKFWKFVEQDEDELMESNQE